MVSPDLSSLSTHVHCTHTTIDSCSHCACILQKHTAMASTAHTASACTYTAHTVCMRYRQILSMYTDVRPNLWCCLHVYTVHACTSWYASTITQVTYMAHTPATHSTLFTHTACMHMLTQRYKNPFTYGCRHTSRLHVCSYQHTLTCIIHKCKQAHTHAHVHTRQTRGRGICKALAFIANLHLDSRPRTPSLLLSAEHVTVGCPVTASPRITPPLCIHQPLSGQLSPHPVLQ